MFSGLALGIGIAMIFLNNQGAAGESPSEDFLLLADGTNYLLADGTPILLQ